MRGLGGLLFCLGLVGYASADTALPLGTGEARFQDTGCWQLVVGGQAVVRKAHLMIAAPGWRSAVDQYQLKVDAAAAGKAHFVGSMADAKTGVAWKLNQLAAVDDGVLRVTYELSPDRATEVSEISLFLDLPVEQWKGKPLSLWPGRDGQFPEQPPKQRHFLTGPLRTLVLDAGQTGQISVRLGRFSDATVQDSRSEKGRGDIYQAYVRLRSGGAVAAGEKIALDITLRTNDPTKYASPRLELVSQRPLKLTEPVASARQVPRYGRFELRFQAGGTYQTPFDPDQIAVDATFVSPSGKRLRVPAFYACDFAAADPESPEIRMPGTADWRVRFAPVETGVYRYQLTARDRTGEARSTEGQFECVASDSPGFVRVSAADRRYFAFDNGQPYFAVGENLATGRTPMGDMILRKGEMDDFTRWLNRLGAAKANYIRVWMCSHSLGIEWGPPGYYRMDHAARMDQIVELAETNGIYIKLCLESWRGFSGERSFVRPGERHPYSKEHGGPCQVESEFFTNPEAQRMFRNRLRYVVARWGYSTHIMGWEFWNEINCVWKYNADAVAAWTGRMARYVNTIDPWQHLVVNSLGSFLVDNRYWTQPEVDFAQVHGYWHPKAKESKELGKDMAAFVPFWVDQIRGHNKPALFAEFGLVNDTWGPSPLNDRDPNGVHLHNGMWSAVMSGAAGTAMLWWWDCYVDPHDLYGRFASVANFTGDVPWTTAGFEPCRPATDVPQARAMALRGKNRVLAWVQNREHTWWNVHEERPAKAIAQVRVQFEGLADGPWQVEFYDTWQGKTLQTKTLRAAGGKLEVELRDLTRDVALKLVRAE